MIPAPRFSPADEAPAGATIAAVTVADFAEAESSWRRLEAQSALLTPYQQFDWVRLWHTHVSVREGIVPTIAVAFDASGEPLAVLPLGIAKHGPLRVARFFGGKHANLNMGLWRADFAAAATASALSPLTRAYAEAGADLLALFNQPVAWDGVPNPLALLPHSPSTHNNHTLALGEPGEAVIARQLSPNSRGKLRTKERKLAALPGYRHARAQSPEDARRYLDAFFAQKAARMKKGGIANAFAEPGIEAFLREACTHGIARGHPVIEIHVLEGGGEVVALFAGTQNGRRFSSMFNSYTLGDAARWSPGLILLTYLIRDIADRGLQSFDLGLGDATYKAMFCPQEEPLFDSFLPLSPLGRLAGVAAENLYSAKRRVKQSEFLLDTLRKLRQFRAPSA